MNSKKRWDEKLSSKIHNRDVRIHKYQFPLIIFFSIVTFYLLPQNPINLSDFLPSLTTVILGTLASATLIKYK